jgi:hypothetical protein
MKSNMYFRYFVCLLAAALLFSACSKEEEEEAVEPQDPFLGAWIIFDAGGDFAEDNVGTTYTFTEAGGITISKGALRSTGTYVRNDDIIEVSLDTGFDLTYDYMLTDTQLTMDNQDNNQIFFLRRP